MTTILIGISVGLGALVVLLLALLVVRWRSDSSTDERVAEVVASLNTRMDELGAELATALERAEEEGRRSRIFGELAGSIDLDEVLTRTLEAAGALHETDAALVMLPDPVEGKPIVATLGLSVEEAERHARTRVARVARGTRDRERATVPRGTPPRRPGRAHRSAQPTFFPRDARARGRTRAPLRPQARTGRVRSGRFQGGQRQDRPPRR